MTEQPPASQAEEPVEPAATSDGFEEGTEPVTGGPTWTGVPAVDQVLRNVDDLHDVPLDEHLSRFEQAHESLRSALDADPLEPGDPA